MGRVKKILVGVGALIGVVAVGGAGFAYSQISAFDASLEKVYATPLPKITASTDPAVIARGEHLAHSLGGCALADCHGKGLVGGRATDAGPLGIFSAPNLTHLASAYSDGEMARLIRFGIKKDGRSVRMMPVGDFSWLPDEDVAALLSFIRSVPKSDHVSAPTVLKPLGKVLDRAGKMPLDIARFVANMPAIPPVPAPARTTEYGSFVTRLCTGCHGEGLSGGPLPGAPPDFPVPSNLTPDESGLKGWVYEDLVKVATQGVNKKGRKLHAFMPIEALAAMNDVERGALFDYLMSLPPKPFGGR